jgi:hypothetical protein
MIAALPILALLAAPPGIPEAEKPRLDAGEIIVHPQTPADDTGFAVKAYAVVSAPLAKVWPHLRDCGRYSEFMPRTKDSAVREGTPDKGVCYIEIGMPFPFSNLWAENLTETTPMGNGGFERRWRLKQGTYSKNQGLWGVAPWGDGTRSLIYYQLEAAPDTVIPDGILRKAQTGVLPDAFEAVRKRVGAP